jgi:predicted RNase H-like HicB family nuclease
LRQFYAVIFKDPAGGFEISFPNLLGCTAKASTYYSCEHAAAKALTAHLRGLEGEGYSIPESSSLEGIMLDPNNHRGVPILVRAGPQNRRESQTSIQRP